MQSDSRLAVRIGIFFTIAVVLLMMLSLQVGKGGFFQKNYEIVAHFNQAAGIERGTVVTLRGVPVGSVTKIDWDPKLYKAAVTLDIQTKYRIPKDATAKVQVSSLLGGNVVNISVPLEVGSKEFLNRGDVIATLETPTIDEVLATISKLSDGTEGLIASLNENQASAFKKINAVVDENREYFKQTSESFSRTGPKLEELSTRLNEMTESVKAGEGTVGRLYKDPTLYDDIKATSDRLKKITEQIQSGEGSLGNFIYKDDFAKDAKAIMADVQRASLEIEKTVAENRENFRKLISSLGDSAPRIEKAINNFNEVSEKINKGEGTLGKLVNDPSLYEDAQKTVNQVGDSFENGEEQGVFRSFLGLVFGALI